MTAKFLIIFWSLIKISLEFNNADIKIMFKELSSYKNFILMNEFASLSEIIEKEGYIVEEYKIVTADDYILTLHRIPFGKNNCKKKQKTPVLCVHGLYASASSFILRGSKHSLGYLLADDGFDVWLANCRASTDSRECSDTTNNFWDFSFHEKGIYDLPAMIDFILKVTGQSKLAYVGHSEGTTNLFVLLSVRSEYNRKISIAFMLSPVAYIKHLRIPFFDTLVNSADFIKLLYEEMGIGEFFPKSNLMLQYLCIKSRSTKFACVLPFILFLGLQMKQYDPKAFQFFLYHAQGASVKELVHFSQLYKTGEFQMFDYGYLENILQYQTPYAPKYDLGKINVPIVLFFSQNDWITAEIDIDKLHHNLKKSLKISVEDETINHLDFLMGKTVKEVIYDKILQILKNPKSLSKVLKDPHLNKNLKTTHPT